MTSVRLPEELEARIAQIGSMTKRSKSFIIKEALEMYLDDVSDLYVALERMKNPGKTYATEELIKELDLKKSDFDDL